jgi:uncharacterized membrane protein required for colicin V production
MTIWLLVLVLMASVAALGYRQGGVRVAFSTVGILIGAMLAKPLGKLLKPVAAAVGVKQPPFAWVLGAIVVFIVISIIFKVAAYSVHQKVDVHYKYRAGDLRLALWGRLNHRLGLCLGFLNGALYCMLIAAIVYPFSYWTYQFANPDKDPRSLVILNRIGKDLQDTGFAKVARALDPMPQVWYDSADLAGLIYHNPLSEARLVHYPAFLGLAERSEFQAIGSDTQFTQARLRQMAIMDFLDHPQVQAIVNNPGLMQAIWNTVVPDMKDLTAYLDTGKSAKYDPETILGRWVFDVSMALTMDLRAKPNISSREMQKLKEWFFTAYSKTTLVAKTDHQVAIRNVPTARSPAAAAAAGSGTQNLQGQWKKGDGKYQISISTAGEERDLTAVVDGDRLSVTGAGMNLFFNREG